MVLLILSILALVIAVVFAVLAWFVVREDRLRTAARVAALGSAALDEDATEVIVTHPVDSTATSLFDRRPSMHGHPLIRIAIGFAMSVALIVVIAMSGSRHTTNQTSIATQADSPLELLSMRPERSGDALTVTGLVRNGGRMPAKGLTAVVFAFDKSGNFLASGRAPLDFVTLAPGDESPFRVTVMQLGDVGRYRVMFRNDVGVVRHVDRRAALQAHAQQ